MGWVEPAIFGFLAVVGFGFWSVCSLLVRIERCLIDLYEICIEEECDEWSAGLEDDTE